MSETVTEAVDVEAHDAHDDAHDHPSDWDYIKIALILAVITAIEVFTYFESVVDWGDFLIPALMVMMVVKFWLVATWFMHLRFDNPIFGRLFVFGLVLASAVYLVTLATFHFWD
jgi:cytochrome c oxidase subunit 4